MGNRAGNKWTGRANGSAVSGKIPVRSDYPTFGTGKATAQVAPLLNPSALSRLQRRCREATPTVTAYASATSLLGSCSKSVAGAEVDTICRAWMARIL